MLFILRTSSLFCLKSIAFKVREHNTKKLLLLLPLTCAMCNMQCAIAIMKAI